MIDYDLQMKTQDEMEAGERLLWSDQPDPKRLSRRAILISLFGIPWTAFALFWVVAAAGFRLPDFSSFSDGFQAVFPLFGIPFVLIGMGMLAAPLWAYRSAKRTVYAITNRRALVISFGRAKKVQSYFEQDIGDINRTERADGSGNLIFRAEETTDNRGNVRLNQIGFFGVRDVRQVERILLDAFKNEDRQSDGF
ncbi:MAG: hypothetical protein AB1631_03470 [Acidobacteriota bacterium]